VELTQQELLCKAKELQQARIARGIKFIREYARGAAAHDFVLQGFLSLDQVKVILKGGSLEKASKEEADTIDTNMNGSNPCNSDNTASKATTKLPQLVLVNQSTPNNECYHWQNTPTLLLFLLILPPMHSL
jgi:hypothetical protein